jgi:hypothetical protein
MSRGSSVSTVSGYWLGDRAIEVRSPVEARGFFFLVSVSRPALRPTQLPLQWVSGILSPGVKLGLGVTLTTHLHREWVWAMHLSSASICVFWHCFLSCDHITEVFDRTGLSAWVRKVYIPQSSLFSLRIQFVTACAFVGAIRVIFNSLACCSWGQDIDCEMVWYKIHAYPYLLIQPSTPLVWFTNGRGENVRL